ncbi:MAG: TlpA family protein disulfide reductase [Actinomycetota bacterium]
MKALSRLWVVALLSLCAVPASAQQLGLGDPAPKLQVSRFAKGAPVASLAPGKVYVVEFWATWCGPCRETAPHLTQLQRKYPQATFIGVSILEEDQSAVAPFVKEMGAKMGYRVALDLVPKGKSGQEGRMAQTWMNAAGKSGIPTAFIVNSQGRIAWIGHPAEMDAPLDKILKGKWDLSAAVTQQNQKRRIDRTLQTLKGKLDAAQKAKNPKAALSAVESALATEPKVEPAVGMLKFALLLQQGGSVERAVAYGNRLVASVYPADPRALTQLAMQLVGAGSPTRPPAARALALKAAMKADRLTKGAIAPIADTLARCYFVSGDPAKALAAQERAVRLGKGAEGAAEMQRSLEQYRKAARGSR